MNLRHLIGMYDLEDDKDEATGSSGGIEYNNVACKKHTAYLSGTATPEDGGVVTRKPLVRIPTCAIFYKVAQGKGVPHTFVGEFICNLTL